MSVPPKLQRIVAMFQGAPKELRLQALLDYAKRVPSLPEHLQQDGLEQVVECQTPFFLAAEVDEEDRVRIWFDCPPEAPTVRGYAGILSEGLNGASVDEVLDLPADFYMSMGLQEVLTPQRMRGMDGIITRLKRQLRDQMAA